MSIKESLEKKLKRWSTKDIPSLKGKLAIVTGATSGIGFETALILTQFGAEVIIASRTPSKGDEALEKIKTICPHAKVSFQVLNLSSLQSIKTFCTGFNARNLPLDILVNNAGLVSYRKRIFTEDGFESQFGTNYLGHFALTAQLLPSLRKSNSPARVVNISSVLHVLGNIGFNDFKSNNKILSKIIPGFAYCKSKLATILFTNELQKRSKNHNWNIISISAHPGFAKTDIFNVRPEQGSKSSFLSTFYTKILVPLLSQSAAEGALSILFAAISEDAIPEKNYGPDGILELKGVPTKAFRSKGAKNPSKAKKLWELSTTLTGVRWE